MIIKNCFYRIYQSILLNVMHIVRYNHNVISGNGAVCRIPGILKKHNIKKVLVFTGPHLVKTSLFKKIIAMFREKGLECIIFSGISAETGTGSVEMARKIYLHHKCSAIIAIGGGSVIDCAKAAAGGTVNPGKSIVRLAGYQKVRKKVPVIIAVPTTAGTGAEATACAVIKDDITGVKKIIADTKIVPRYAVLDPVMTARMPGYLTAYTGMDALTHATESYLNKYSSEVSRANAQAAVNLIIKNIIPAYYKTGGISPRKNMLDASYLAGCAFVRTSVGYVHAIGHAIGGRYNLSHGMVVAVVLPYVLEWYGRCIYGKLARLADISCITEKNMSVKKKAETYINYIKMLNHKFKIDRNFYKELSNSIQRENISLMVQTGDKREDNGEKIAKDNSIKTNITGKVHKNKGIAEKDVKKIAKYAIMEANPYYPVPKIMALSECEKLVYRICTRQ